MDDRMVTKAVATAQKPHMGLVDSATTPHNTLLVKELKKYASLIKAGIKVGDEIVSFGPFHGGEIESKSDDVVAHITKVGVGGTIPAKIKRDGKLLEIPVKLIARKNLDLTLEDVDLALERKIAP
jgi:predicted metalloprotease with PDZ domain